jgi:hypothetical protein
MRLIDGVLAGAALDWFLPQPLSAQTTRPDGRMPAALEDLA